MRKSLKIGIVGAGRVGSNLAYWLSRNGYHIQAVYSRKFDSAKMLANAIPTGAVNDLQKIFISCDTIFLAVPDGALVPIAEEIKEFSKSRAKILLHCSGMMPSSVLGLAGMEYRKASMHPIASIPPLSTTQNPFKNVIFGIEGDDEAVAIAGQMIEDLGGIAHRINPAQKALYHSAALFAANFVFVLAHISQQLYEQCGFSQKLAKQNVENLIRSALTGYARHGMPQSMTGPVSRGDLQTVMAHLDALKDSDYREFYIIASRVAAEIVGKEEMFEEIFNIHE